jgi:hypothetical protein
MDGRKRSEVPPRLARAATRLAAWRRTHVPHTRIPRSLWNGATKLAAEFGISYTATRLRLNYNDLKKHVEATAPISRHTSVRRQMASFVELPASTFPTAGECVIELQNTAGSTMRIEIKGSHCPDLVALSAAFYSVKR